MDREGADGEEGRGRMGRWGGGVGRGRMGRWGGGEGRGLISLHPRPSDLCILMEGLVRDDHVA